MTVSEKLEKYREICKEALDLLEGVGMKSSEILKDYIDRGSQSGYTGGAITDVLKEAVVMFEKKEKYKWHDLRKNPDDLPNKYDCDWVIVQIEENNGYRWIPCTAEYRPQIDDWLSDQNEVGWLKYHNGAFKVISWKEIEPFEEGDTDVSK